MYEPLMLKSEINIIECGSDKFFASLMLPLSATFLFRLLFQYLAWLIIIYKHLNEVTNFQLFLSDNFSFVWFFVIV